MADIYTALYFFKGSKCILIDPTAPKGTVGDPQAIGDVWPGLKGTEFEKGVDAAELLPGSSQNKVVFVKGDKCVVYNIAADTIYPYDPLTGFFQIPKTDTVGLKQGFDALVEYDDAGKSYLFKGRNEVRGTLSVESWIYSEAGPNNFGIPADWTSVHAAAKIETGTLLYLFFEDQYHEYYTGKSGKISDLWDVHKLFEGSPSQSIDAALSLPVAKKSASGGNGSDGGNGDNGGDGGDGNVTYTLNLPTDAAFYVAMINNSAYPRHFKISADGNGLASGPSSVTISPHSGQLVPYKTGSSGNVVFQLEDSKFHAMDLKGKTEKIGAGHYANIGAQKPTDSLGFVKDDVMLTVFWPFIDK